MTGDLEYRRHLSKSVYTGMGGWGKLRAQTRAEAKGAEMKIFNEQKWAVNPTNITAEPLNSPAHWRVACHRALNNPQLNWQHLCLPFTLLAIIIIEDETY